MTNVLVTGAAGLLGGTLVAELADRYGITGVCHSIDNPAADRRYHVDLTDGEAVRAMMDAVRPDAIIHCAALTNVDLCERDHALARAVNALATRTLLMAMPPGAHFVYISTDSVFDGRRGGYSESDLPSPLNSYAKTKLEGEWFTEQLAARTMIVRTNMVGWNRVHGQSFAEWICTNLAAGQAIKMFTDVVFSPVAVTTLARLLARIVDGGITGRLHIGSVDGMSKYEFGVRLARLFGYDEGLITPVSVDSFSFAAPRPGNTTLNTAAAQAVLGPLPELAEELSLLHKLKESHGKNY